MENILETDLSKLGLPNKDEWKRQLLVMFGEWDKRFGSLRDEACGIAHYSLPRHWVWGKTLMIEIEHKNRIRDFVNALNSLNIPLVTQAIQIAKGGITVNLETPPAQAR